MMANDVITLLCQANPEIPLYMYAHSMGAMITLKILLSRTNLKVSGVVLTGPFLNLPSDRHFPKAKLFFAKKLGDDL